MIWGPMSFRQWSIPRKVAVVVAATLLVNLVGLAAMVEYQFRDRHDDLESELARRRQAVFTDPGSTRFLVVGDSFTAGELSQAKVGFWAYLPDALEQYGYHNNTEVISLAMAGTTSQWHFHQVARWVEETGQVPHYVFITTGANNNHSYAFQTHFLEHGGEADGMPVWLRQLYRVPRSWFWGLDQVAHRMGYASLDDPTKVAFRPLVGYWRDNDVFMAWVNRLIGRWVGAMDDLGKAKGFTTLVGSYVRTGFHDPLRALARKRKIKMFDIESHALETCMREWGMYTSDDWHPNDLGHKYLARRLARWLVSEILPGPDGNPPDPRVVARQVDAAPLLRACTNAPRHFP